MPSLLMSHLSGESRSRWITATLLYAVSIVAFAQGSAERVEAEARAAQQSDTVLVARTGSPRQTLQSLLNQTREAEILYQQYRQDRTHANGFRMSVNQHLLLDLLDLSEKPAALRKEGGFNAAYALADILARVELPPMESVPDWDPFDESTPGTWRIPGTPITIARIDVGPRAGEFLFSASTVAAAPGFFERIRHLPLKRPSAVESWTDLIPQETGPVFPAALVDALPDSLKKSILDTPIWKILTSVAALSLAAVLLVFVHRRVGRRSPDSRFVTLIRRMLTPLAAIALVWVWYLFVQAEVNVTGAFAKFTDSTLSVVDNLAFAWLFWLAVLAVFEWMIRSPRISEESLNASLMRLSARVIGFLGVLLIIALGAKDLGVPVLGVVAGLGFGGLAVALAIRPTLENMVGGVILFMDKPVRVGDFCSFGNHRGTVERIGIRSTRFRALDRTLISIPNATFVNMELINWAECDHMLITATIGLRYETDSDQLRYVLVKFREMLHAHPKIDPDTVRVRFAGYGASSLDIGVRVYALTREWNGFHEIREDIFLRMKDIVEESGTGVAFPSQTLYMGRDDGLDAERGEAAIEEVRSWRREGKLPFPGLSADRIAELEATLDYPPRGSVEIGHPEEERPEVAEPLSAEPDTEDADKVKGSSDGGNPKA